MRTTGVYLVGEQALFRHALAFLISSQKGYKVIGEFSSCREAFESAAFSGDYLYIADAELPGSQIRDLASAVKGKDGKVVICGSIYNKIKLMEALAIKADGYLLSNVSEKDFFLLLDKVRMGIPAISDSLIPELVNVLSAKSDNGEMQKMFLLTPREKEILKLLAEGYTNERIARKLVISFYTVKNHIHNMLGKLGIENRSQLVCYAYNSGLVKGQAG